MNKEIQTRRQALLAARAACLAKMRPSTRHAFEQRHGQGGEGLTKAGQGGCGAERNSLLAQVSYLVAEANRLRQSAESKRDPRTALRGLDTALRALLLYGKTTGEISTARRSPKPAADAVPTREEGLHTATELLLALATAEEISDTIARLEQRRRELCPASPAGADNNPEAGQAAAAKEATELAEMTTPSDAEGGELDPEFDCN